MNFKIMFCVTLFRILFMKFIIKSAKDIRIGNIIILNNKPMVILRSDVNSSSRTSLIYKWKMKNLLTNTQQENVFRGDDKFKVIILDKKVITYSYFSYPLYIFVDTNYQQYEINEKNLGDVLHYLKYGMICEAIFYEDQIISVELPINIVRQIIYSEPAIKGNTSGNVFKKAKIENAIQKHQYTIMVPLFVIQHDLIEIDTRTNEYKKTIRI